MSEFRFPPGVTHIPQIDFSVVFNQNGGVTGSQSYLAKKSEIKKGSLLANTFAQGNILWNIDPNCPVPYRNFRLVSFTASDYAPGIVSIACDYSGAEFATGEGTTPGEPAGLTTYTLRGTIEERPLSMHRKWQPLSEDDKHFLSALITGEMVLGPDGDDPGKFVEKPLAGPALPDGQNSYMEFIPAVTRVTQEPYYFIGDALDFAKMIVGGVQTFKAPSWTYSVRQEGVTGMTTGQLNALGKYANPPGNPPKPTSGYTWMLVGPDQEQVGDARFIKDFNFLLIEKNDAHDFLYQ